MLLSVDAGPDGFDRFWTLFWLVSVNSGCILLTVDAALDGFALF